jgi:DNA-directed RNA polymerase specialized sigma24 family protein
VTIPDLSRSDIERLMHEWLIGPNAERDRAILARRLFDGITFERLAEEFEMSVRQTKQIVYRGTERIFHHIPG